MNEPWSTQVASDVIRDGLGLELLDGAGRVSAEVFRCDADRTVTVRLFQNSIPSDVLVELMDLARTKLVEFEDGTPLPTKFRIQNAV